MFEDLKSVETPPPMGGHMVWWLDGWVDWCGQVKSLKCENFLPHQDDSILFEDL